MKRFLCGLMMVAACTVATGCDQTDPAAKSVMDAARSYTFTLPTFGYGGDDARTDTVVGGWSGVGS